MFVYRIAKTEERARDLSGTGAFLYGGRWNSIGTYMLYTSANSSLAYLETLVHINEPGEVPKFYIAEIKVTESLIYQVPDRNYPKFWQQHEDTETQATGDRWISDHLYLGFKVKSTINPLEYNYLLNPLFPRFHDLVKITSVTPLGIDTRLFR